MGSPPVSSDISFPPADVDGELNPASGNNVHVEVDPVSSEVSATKNSKEQSEAKEEKKEGKKKDALQAIIVSSIIVAVAGVVFAVTKKLREK